MVEDSSAMRAFVRAALEDTGADVSEASSGFEALRLLPREPWELVVVDINMPDINGLELIAFMRKSEQHGATPVILISTEASARDRQRGLDLGEAPRDILRRFHELLAPQHAHIHLALQLADRLQELRSKETSLESGLFCKIRRFLISSCSS